MSGWTKAEYEGKVCWEQNGQRLFDTADIEKLEEASKQSHKPDPDETGVTLLLVATLIIGIIIGVFISVTVQ